MWGAMGGRGGRWRGSSTTWSPGAEDARFLIVEGAGLERVGVWPEVPTQRCTVHSTGTCSRTPPTICTKSLGRLYRHDLRRNRESEDGAGLPGVAVSGAVGVEEG